MRAELPTARARPDSPAGHAPWPNPERANRAPTAPPSPVPPTSAVPRTAMLLVYRAGGGPAGSPPAVSTPRRRPSSQPAGARLTAPEGIARLGMMQHARGASFGRIRPRRSAAAPWTRTLTAPRRAPTDSKTPHQPGRRSPVRTWPWRPLTRGAPPARRPRTDPATVTFNTAYRALTAAAEKHGRRSYHGGNNQPRLGRG